MIDSPDNPDKLNWRPGRVSEVRMPPPVKKGGVTAQLAESVQHLERLVNYCIEWQTDWAAISSETKAGKPNPDFDKEYLLLLRDHPEEVYEPAVLAAREFLKSLKR